jgi:uncharacterized membrane protein YoaK (UPF0700 family)
MRARLAAQPDRLHLLLMMALTFSTGIIDAVGYLGLDRVFTGNMTGNVVILGMALLGADGLPIVGPVVALAGFVVGAVVAGRVLRGVPSGGASRSTALFIAVGALVLTIAVCLSFAGDPLEQWIQLAVTGGLGFAMGIQAATARHIAVKDVTTVVVTSTLTGLAADSRLGGNTGQPWKRRLGAVVLICSGAALGAAALNAHLSLGLYLSGGITLIAAILGHLGHQGRSVDDPDAS